MRWGCVWFRSATILMIDQALLLVQDDAPRLRESIQQLAQLEDEIPFGDEHGLRTAAKWLLAHWPEGGRWGE